MIDYFALALTHALLAVALLRILTRDELDHEDPLADISADVDGREGKDSSRSGRRRKRSRHA